MSKNWNCHKAKLRQLYLEEGRTLDEVKEILEEKHGFIASIRAYRMKFDEWDFRKYKSSKNPKVRYVSPKRANTPRKSTTTGTEIYHGTTLPVTIGLDVVQQNPICSAIKTTTSSLPLASLQSPILATQSPSLPQISPEEASLYPELNLPHFTYIQNSFATEPMRTIHIRAGRMSASELSGLLGVDSQHAIEAFFMKWQNDGDYLTEVLKRIRKTQIAGHILNSTIYGTGNIFNLLQERVPAKDHRVLIAALLNARFPPKTSSFVPVPREDWVIKLCEAFSTIDSVGWEENKRDFNGDCVVQKAGGEKLVLGALSLLAERRLARYRRSLVKFTKNDEITLPLPLHPIAKAYTAMIRDTEKRGLEINVSWYIYNLTLERLVRNTLTVDNAYSPPFNSL